MPIFYFICLLIQSMSSFFWLNPLLDFKKFWDQADLLFLEQTNHLKIKKVQFRWNIYPVWDWSKAMSLTTFMSDFKERYVSFKAKFNPRGIFCSCSVSENLPPMKSSAKSGKEIPIPGISFEKQTRHTPSPKVKKNNSE